MSSQLWRSLCAGAFALSLIGCEKPVAPAPVSESKSSPSKIIPGVGGGGPVSNIDAKEKETAATLKPAKCPVQEEIYAYRIKVRQALNNRQFDDLEKLAADARATKEVFGNGSWKIAQFYDAFELMDDEPESMWNLHEEIRKAWVVAKPKSMTAKVAHIGFLVDYAWHARGAGFSDTVTEKGWLLFKERMDGANQVLREASALEEKDPVWALRALEIGRGQGWKPEEMDKLANDAFVAEPAFWGYHTERAFSLLPRWYGEPGDWEKYAERVSASPRGPGDELYARIILHLEGFHENIFEGTKASWPKTREGLRKMLAKYPKSLELLNRSAELAGLAQDRTFAKEMFDKIGDSYLPRVWGKPDRFVHVRNWAETGKW